jgi:hypothetical protein
MGNIASQSEVDIDQDGNPAGDPPTSKRFLRGLGILLIALAFLVTLYGAVAYTAWQRGQKLRVLSAQQALQEESARQTQMAREDIRAGNPVLAARRLEWVLNQDPINEEARMLLQEVQAMQNVRPTETPRPTPTESAVAEPQQTPADPDTVADFANLQELMDDEKWQAAVTAIVAFQARFPNYQRQETDQMLYDAYVSLGLNLLYGPQVELGLYYLEQAEKLGSLSQEVEDQRTWAELYLLGISYYGVDWSTTLFYFRGLCVAAPFYQDSCAKLREALIAYGDQYAVSLDWCPAEELYAEALRQESGRTLAEKLQQASAMCREATPTPSAPITGTVPISTTVTPAVP